MKMRILALILMSLFQFQLSAQDVWLQNFFSPTSGCELSNTELVNVLINNNSGSFIPAGSITVSYSIDGGAPVSEILGVNLAAGASWNFTFAVTADLSTCGSYDMMAWVSFATDPNPLNDSLSWVVVNDCIIVPGSVISDSTVCEGMNDGILNLIGWTNGTILDWQFSTDSGSTWINIGNATTSNSYTDIDTTTLYHVIFDGGFCPDDSSNFATVTVQPFPVGGTISASATHCIDDANGTLTLSGESGAVIFWQYSENDGASWTTLANSTNTQNYVGLITDTWYRTSTDGLICPDVYSDTAIITVDDLTVVGTLMADDTICEGSTVSLALLGYNGSVLDWESSEDLVVWTPLGDTDGIYDSPPLTQTTYYRVQVQNGVCAALYSDTVTITVGPLPVGGTINSSFTHCESSVTGLLNLVGSAGSVNFWEYSEDSGGIWNTIANITTTEAYTGLTMETWYRVQIEGWVCADVYSDTAIISIDPLTVSGTLGVDTLLCEQSVLSLELLGYNGSILDWEYSEDLLVWNPMGEFDAYYDTPPLSLTTYYRALVKSGVCPAMYSDTATITIETNSVGGIINGSMVLCEAVASDTLILTGYIGPITTWEQSTDNGASWGVAPGTNDSLIFVGMSDTTWYRVLFEGTVCPDTYSDTAIITIHADSDAGILVNDATICEGESIDLLDVGNVGASIVWESSEDLVLWNVFANDTVGQTVTPGVTTTYRVIVQSESCPEDTSNFVIITVNTMPIVDAGIDVTITEFDTIQLNGSVGSTVIWSPGTDLSDPAIDNPLAWPTSTITYTYMVTTAEGCQRSDEITITVEPFIEPSINIRNVITANNDGYNDFWMITGIEDFPETEVKVFNIYGQLVYESMDYKNDWGGTFKGNKLPNGTYYFSVKLREVEELIKGNLTILGNE